MQSVLSVHWGVSKCRGSRVIVEGEGKRSRVRLKSRRSKQPQKTISRLYHHSKQSKIYQTKLLGRSVLHDQHLHCKSTINLLRMNS